MALSHGLMAVALIRTAFRMPQDFAMSRGVDGVRDLNSRQVQVISVTSMLIFLSSLAVGLRFVARHMLKSKLHMDDYVIVIALVR